VAPIQILAGDQHGLNTLEHQPVKIMGMEGHYQSHPDGAPLILFGWEVPCPSAKGRGFESGERYLRSPVQPEDIGQPRAGDAAFAIVEENAHQCAVDSGVQVRIGKDDVGRFAAQFHGRLD
jgi:bd-type cytochrome oxidase subunit I